MVALVPDTEHTPGVVELKVTPSPAVDVAASGTGVALNVCGEASGGKFMVCVCLATTSVNACVALGRLPLAAVKLIV